MIFSSVTFLIYFLPFCFGLLYCLPKTYHNGFLLVMSLLFYSWTSPSMTILLLFEIAAGFYGGRLISHYRSHAKGLLCAFILLFAGLFCFFKYTDFLISNINVWMRTSIPLLNLVLPLGISFYTFQIISYLVDVYTHRTPPQKSFVIFALYVSMFPQLIAGPIVRYDQVEKDLKTRNLNAVEAAQGANRFLCGLAKKVILANQLYGLMDTYRMCAQPSVVYAWFNALITVFFIYFDFSGYSDMAIGLGKMLGFHFPENFNYPLIASSITEFWRRWNMSLTAWFKDYVYIPLGGNRVGVLRHLFNLLVIWLLTGIWHGARWNYLFWGLGFFVILVSEKYVISKLKIPLWIRCPFIWLILIVSFQLFYAENLGQFAADFRILFGMSSLPVITPLSLYEIRDGLMLVLIALFAIMPAGKAIYNRFTATKASLYLQPVLSALIFLVCLSYLVSGSLNPFVYFQF